MGQVRMVMWESRYQYALGPIMRSCVNSIVMARFILTDSLASARTASDLIGREPIPCPEEKSG